mgnify:CR=1 FL=1
MEVLVIGIKEMQINEEITDKEVRLISNDGEQLGIVSAAQAQKLAAEKNLDLVKIAPQAKPPVCKIMDYGKYRFEQSKREKEAKKNQRVIEIKEIRLSPNIDVHDFDTKGGSPLSRQKVPVGRQQDQGLDPLPRTRDDPHRSRTDHNGSVCGEVRGYRLGREAGKA